MTPVADSEADMEVMLASEAAQIRSAREELLENGLVSELRDFDYAKRIANQHGNVEYRTGHDVEGSPSRYGRKRKLTKAFNSFF